jgi:hypothetical protein
MLQSSGNENGALGADASPERTRERVVELLGRILARHWLRQQANDERGGKDSPPPTANSVPPQRE